VFQIFCSRTVIHIVCVCQKNESRFSFSLRQDKTMDFGLASFKQVWCESLSTSHLCVWPVNASWATQRNPYWVTQVLLVSVPCDSLHMVLGIEPKTLHMLGKSSSTWAPPTALLHDSDNGNMSFLQSLHILTVAINPSGHHTSPSVTTKPQYHQNQKKLVRMCTIFILGAK
jgi:hypothetical protein